ncbi:hypothetical protein B0H12DRAFT_1225950 [Mycena haematopus]|nr:hypothetical protein B0H12DRAFT_1225950 [Mycena haematopus]
MDVEASSGVTIQDMLSHRTGLPRHDYSGQPRAGGVGEMIGWPSGIASPADALESHHHVRILHRRTHLRAPGHERVDVFRRRGGAARDGFQWSMKDALAGKRGTLTATVWANHGGRRAEGYIQTQTPGGDGDVLVGLDNRFVAEWVAGAGAEDGFAFSGDFWGKKGEVRELEGGGRVGAEVWFGRVG